MATAQRTGGTGEVTQAQQVRQFNASARLMSAESAELQEEVFFLHNYGQQKHLFIFYYLLSCT